MPITPADLATAVAKVADRLERHGVNPFRVRVSRFAARAVGGPALDPIDVRCRTARADSVPVAITGDARSVHDFDNLVHEVDQARRHWLDKTTALDTRSLESQLCWHKRKEAR